MLLDQLDIFQDRELAQDALQRSPRANHFLGQQQRDIGLRDTDLKGKRRIRITLT